MRKRKTTPTETEKRVLINSRRRCCLCFGLDQDLDFKRQGQIAHIDRNSQNDAYTNLAYLCLEHHDQYDTKTSQSKGLTPGELQHYRDELYLHLEDWGTKRSKKENLLHYLAAQIDITHMAQSALRIASRFGWDDQGIATEALSKTQIEYIDQDLYIPLLGVLEYYQEWGWLSFEYKMKQSSYDEDGEACFITITRESICEEIVKEIKAITQKNDENLSRH